MLRTEVVQDTIFTYHTQPITLWKSHSNLCHFLPHRNSIVLKALQSKADNIFWDGALYFPRVVSLQQLLQETKPNPPICKLDRKSITQTGIWFRTEGFTQCLRSILDKSNLFAKHLRGERKFLLCCLNAVIRQDAETAWHCCPQWNTLCISHFHARLMLLSSCPVQFLQCYPEEKILSPQPLALKVKDSTRGDEELLGRECFYINFYTAQSWISRTPQALLPHRIYPKLKS